MPMDMDSRQDEEEDVMFNEFQKLKESNFLKKHMLIFISIISVIGISSFFIPEIYAIVPVYETQQCLSYFTNSPFIEIPCDSIVFTMNVYSYLLLNWMELLLLVLVCFKIRNVKDELSIIKELLWIAGFWIICSFFYFLMFSIPNFLSQ